jgi:uncharacterized protein (TIGR04551 family)
MRRLFGEITTPRYALITHAHPCWLMALRTLLIALMMLPGATTFAEDAEKSAASTGEVKAQVQREGRQSGLYSVEHDLTVRLRPELLSDGDLGSAASPIPRALNAKDGETSLLSWASMRVRYGATLHLGQRFRLRVSMDALENVVLGSTPAGAAESFETGLFEDGQGSPTTGINAFEDALLIREAFGSWNFLGLIDMDFGRMRDHFGSGLIRHRGDCRDCDRGTVVDGLRLGLDLFGVRAEGSVEFTDVGALDADTGWDGQTKDLGVDDNTVTYTLRVLSGKSGSLSQRQREAFADHSKDMSIDWGVFFSFTEQEFSTENQSGGLLPSQCTQGAAATSDQLSWDCWQLKPRQLFIWKPSVWAKLDWRPDFRSHLRVELELAGQFGDVVFLQGDPELGDTSKDFAGFAGALDLTYQQGALSAGLSSGFASGDDRQYLGYQDGQNIVDHDDANYEANDNVRTNATVDSFWFNTDYKVDLLLFRQIIGGVTNAYYVKPWVAYSLFDTDAMKLKARLDVAYAGAMDSAGTPGKGEHWGVELDAGLQLTLPEGFEVALDAGVLFPMDALNDPITGQEPSMSFGLRTLLIWRL